MNFNLKFIIIEFEQKMPKCQNKQHNIFKLNSIVETQKNPNNLKILLSVHVDTFYLSQNI